MTELWIRKRCCQFLVCIHYTGMRNTSLEIDNMALEDSASNEIQMNVPCLQRFRTDTKIIVRSGRQEHAKKDEMQELELGTKKNILTLWVLQ